MIEACEMRSRFRTVLLRRYPPLIAQDRTPVEERHPWPLKLLLSEIQRLEMPLEIMHEPRCCHNQEINMTTKSDLGLQEAKRTLAREKSSLALLIGNGINLMSRATGGISWDQLMENLITSAAANSPNTSATAERLKQLLERGGNGQTPASLPEVFDIIEATGSIKPGSTAPSSSDIRLQSTIAQMLKGMKPSALHKALVSWAAQSRVPILTTNYDHCLQDALDDEECKQRRFGTQKALSDFYPWDRYYAPIKLIDPASEFAVWHIHGDRDLKRSIRAGLDQYMGMVQRLRKLKRSVAKEILGGPNENQEHNPAFHAAPWLRTFMGKKLWIQGLGLRAAEVSLRWLLVQRFRYWRRYRPEHRRASGWYVHGPTDDIGPLDRERRIFFENVGLEIIELAKAADFYIGLFRLKRPPLDGM